MVTLICFVLMYLFFKICDIIILLLERHKIRKGELSEPMKHYEFIRSEYSISKVLQLRKLPYGQYLDTEHWQLLREAVLSRDGYKCADCGVSSKVKHLEAHHRTYANKGNESLDDLTTLCRECHEERHTMKVAYE